MGLDSERERLTAQCDRDGDGAARRHARRAPYRIRRHAGEYLGKPGRNRGPASPPEWRRAASRAARRRRQTARGRRAGRRGGGSWCAARWVPWMPRPGERGSLWRVEPQAMASAPVPSPGLTRAAGPSAPSDASRRSASIFRRQAGWILFACVCTVYLPSVASEFVYDDFEVRAGARARALGCAASPWPCSARSRPSCCPGSSCWRTCWGSPRSRPGARRAAGSRATRVTGAPDRDTPWSIWSRDVWPGRKPWVGRFRLEGGGLSYSGPSPMSTGSGGADRATPGASALRAKPRRGGSPGSRSRARPPADRAGAARRPRAGRAQRAPRTRGARLGLRARGRRHRRGWLAQHRAGAGPRRLAPIGGRKGVVFAPCRACSTSPGA